MSNKNQPHYGSGGDLITRSIPGDGAIEVRGTSVPTDATAGYAKGCLYIKTDGGIGSTLYVNEGSNTSCDFNAK